MPLFDRDAGRAWWRLTHGASAANDPYKPTLPLSGQPEPGSRAVTAARPAFVGCMRWLDSVAPARQVTPGHGPRTSLRNHPPGAVRVARPANIALPASRDTTSRTWPRPDHWMYRVQAEPAPGVEPPLRHEHRGMLTGLDGHRSSRPSSGAAGRGHPTVLVQVAGRPHTPNCRRWWWTWRYAQRCQSEADIGPNRKCRGARLAGSATARRCRLRMDRSAIPLESRGTRALESGIHARPGLGAFRPGDRSIQCHPLEDRSWRTGLHRARRHSDPQHRLVGIAKVTRASRRRSASPTGAGTRGGAPAAARPDHSGFSPSRCLTWAPRAGFPDQPTLAPTFGSGGPSPPEPGHIRDQLQHVGLSSIAQGGVSAARRHRDAIGDASAPTRREVELRVAHDDDAATSVTSVGSMA